MATAEVTMAAPAGGMLRDKCGVIVRVLVTLEFAASLTLFLLAGKDGEGKYVRVK